MPFPLNFRSLPVGTRLVLGALVAAGFVCLGLSLSDTHFRHPLPLLSFLAFSVLAAGLDVSLPIPGSRSKLALSHSVEFAAFLVLGPNEAAAIAAVDGWVQSVFRDQPPDPAYLTLFGMAGPVLSFQAAGLVYGWLGGALVTAAALPSPSAVISAAALFVLGGAAWSTIAASVRLGQPVAGIWRDQFLWVVPGSAAGAAAGTAAAILIVRSDPVLAAVAAVPVYLIYRAARRGLERLDNDRRHCQAVSNLHFATIEALALAIDTKDHSSHEHTRRMQTYAAGLAGAMGMSSQEVHGVRTAALLHDIGKLDVPTQILSKPGPLTSEEFEEIRIHSQAGADIVAHVPFPYPVAPLIRSHHERWDGRGYPAGLRGKEIPLGARILAVVDYFDALTSDRAHRPATSPDIAVNRLRQEAGKAFDPAVVARFLEILPQLRVEAEHAPAAPSATNQREALADGDVRVADPSSAHGHAMTFESVAQAHREVCALYEIAQAMGTSLGLVETMGLVSSKLSMLVPFSTCTLSLYDEGSETLQCRFASGVDADLFRQINAHVGLGLLGWVARHRRTLLNANPAADLELAARPVVTTLQSALVCPLVLDERLIGTLALYHVEAGRYNEEHRRLLNRVSEQAAAVICNSLVFEKTQKDSLTDPLTDLPNTRYMVMHLTRELARAARLDLEVSLLVMDIDNFKEINDRHGHNVGDRALREVAAALQRTVRPYDICARYAGDEFIVVLSDCGAEEAERKRLELQAVVDGIDFEARPGRKVPISLSIGASVFPQDGDAYEALLDIADSRMYRDKTRRKRARLSRLTPPAYYARPDDVSDAEVRQAAAGVL